MKKIPAEMVMIALQANQDHPLFNHDRIVCQKIVLESESQIGLGLNFLRVRHTEKSEILSTTTNFTLFAKVHNAQIWENVGLEGLPLS